MNPCARSLCPTSRLCCRHLDSGPLFSADRALDAGMWAGPTATEDCLGFVRDVRPSSEAPPLVIQESP